MMPASIPASARRFIRSNLPIGPVPSVPEIRLHRAGPGSGLRRLAALDDGFGTPYWAYDWGGGLALARHMLECPETVAGKRVLDLGSGSGIVAIAAMKAGAAAAIAADTDPYAVAATGLNASVNGVRVTAIQGDPTAAPPPAVDLVLVGDLFYDRGLAERVTDFLGRCVAAQIGVLVGDPGRAFLPLSRLRLLAEYPGPDFAAFTDAARRTNAVFSFQAA